MGVDAIRETASRLTASAEALAALGAALRLRSSGTRATPEVEAALDGVLDALGLAEAVSSASPDELAEALSPIRALFLQSVDLLTDPGRAPGWSYTDADVLESQGRSSAGFASIIHQHVVPRLEGLAERLAGPGASFLDVGVGVGGLAIAMCREWNALRVVGIDPWDPALTLARRNVAAAGLADRIELRHQAVEDLDDTRSFDLAFLPGPFLPARVLEPAVERVREAVKPGGWILLGLYRGTGELDAALARLRTVRSGGSVATPEEGVELLARAGLESVSVLDTELGIPALLVAARRSP